MKIATMIASAATAHELMENKIKKKTVFDTLHILIY